MIVPSLIEPIDGPLDGGYLSIGHVWTAGDILLMPQFEIESVLLANYLQAALAIVADGLLVPLDDRLLVQFQYCFDINHF